MMTERKALVENKQNAVKKVFLKEQLATSGKFAGRRDLIETLLEDGRQYSILEAEKIIENFMKGKVR